MLARHVTGHLTTTNVQLTQLLDRNGEVEFSGEVVCAGRYTMALASHDPSFSPDAPVSPFDPGGSAHLGAWHHPPGMQT
jgi:hypothetical protein